MLPERLLSGWHALLLAISTCHRGVWRQVTQHCVLLQSKTSLAPCAKNSHSFGPAAWPCATTHAMCSTGIPGPFHGHHITTFLSKHHLNCFSTLSACLPRWQSTLTVTCELLCPTSGAPSQHLLAHSQCTLSVLYTSLYPTCRDPEQVEHPLNTSTPPELLCHCVQAPAESHSGRIPSELLKPLCPTCRESSQHLLKTLCPLQGGANRQGSYVCAGTSSSASKRWPSPASRGKSLSAPGCCWPTFTSRAGSLTWRRQACQCWSAGLVLEDLQPWQVDVR